MESGEEYYHTAGRQTDERYLYGRDGRQHETCFQEGPSSITCHLSNNMHLILIMNAISIVARCTLVRRRSPSLRTISACPLPYDSLVTPERHFEFFHLISSLMPASRFSFFEILVLDDGHLPLSDPAFGRSR